MIIGIVGSNHFYCSKLFDFLALHRFLDLGLPSISVLEAVSSLLIVIESLLQFLLRIHHEGPMLRNRLSQWLSSNQHKSSSLLRGKSMDCLLFFLRLLKEATVHMVHQLLILINYGAFVNKNDGIPCAWDG